jgi:Carboxypeptidase regulatory-like domain
MKRVVYFCLLLLSWAPHARGMQPSVTRGTGRLRTVQGVVMDVQNLPLTDTVVRLWRDAERKTMLLEGKTDADGKFRLAGLRRGTYFIEFLAPGFHPYLTEMKVSNVSSATGFVFSPLMSSTRAGGAS